MLLVASLKQLTHISERKHEMEIFKLNYHFIYWKSFGTTAAISSQLFPNTSKQYEDNVKISNFWHSNFNITVFQKFIKKLANSRICLFDLKYLCISGSLPTEESSRIETLCCWMTYENKEIWIWISVQLKILTNIFRSYKVQTWSSDFQVVLIYLL